MNSLPGYLAWGNNKVGSYFIHTLCGVLQEYGGDYHLGDVATKVNEVLAESVSHHKGRNCNVVEVGDIHHTLTRKLYFNPRGTFPDVFEEKEKPQINNGGRGRTIVKVRRVFRHIHSLHTKDVCLDTYTPLHTKDVCLDTYTPYTLKTCV